MRTILSTTQENFMNVLISYLYDKVGVLFIRAFPNAPRPDDTTAYGSVNFLTGSTIGIPELSYEVFDATQLTETVRELEEVRVSINIYAGRNNDNTFDIAKQVKLKLKTSDATEYFSLEGIGIVNSTKSRTLYEERSFGNEERTQFDVMFNITSVETNLVDNVEAVSVEAFKSENGETKLINTTLTERN